MHPQLLPDKPGECPDYRWREGKQYWSLRQLAARRGITRQAASAWARRHPDKCKIFGKHVYARDEPT